MKPRSRPRASLLSVLLRFSAISHTSDFESVPGNGPAARELILHAHERAFRENFEALLENPEFLPDGGTLGFGLRHIYPIEYGIKHIYDLLKGSDSVVYRSARALGFEPLLYMLYEQQRRGMDSIEGGLIEDRIKFEDWEPDVAKVVRSKGGIVVCQDPDVYLNEDGAYDRPEKIEWVTPKTTFNEQESRFIQMDEYEVGFVYGHLCLVVRVGKAGERLAYPTSAQLRKVWKSEDNARPTAFWGRGSGFW